MCVCLCPCICDDFVESNLVDTVLKDFVSHTNHISYHTISYHPPLSISLLHYTLSPLLSTPFYLQFPTGRSWYWWNSGRFTRLPGPEKHHFGQDALCAVFPHTSHASSLLGADRRVGQAAQGLCLFLFMMCV